MRAVSATVACTLVISVLLSACGVSTPAAPSTVSTTSPVSADTEFTPSYDTLVNEGFADPSIPRITAADLKTMMDRGEKMILIDTRSEFLFKQGHLPGAVNIPYAVGVPGAEDPMNSALKALPDETLKVLYCS